MPDRGATNHENPLIPLWERGSEADGRHRGLPYILERTGMKVNGKRKSPEIVLRDGKPKAVILDINEYQKMLKRLGDIEKLEMFREMRKKPLRFRRDDLLKRNGSFDGPEDLSKNHDKYLYGQTEK